MRKVIAGAIVGAFVIAIVGGFVFGVVAIAREQGVVFTLAFFVGVPLVFWTVFWAIDVLSGPTSRG